MKEYKPLIGVTPWYDYEKKITFIKTGYFEGIINAGGIPVLLPLDANTEILEEVFNRCEGFLISGGPDLDAKHYGENNKVYNGEISPHRDAIEIDIAKMSIKHGKSLLGICRGAQIMNVAQGGTLYQDIHSQLDKGDLIKHSQNAPRWYPTHEIHIDRGSKVWDAYLKECINVNSFHHQAVKDLAPEFAVTSRSVDGIIESIEHKSHKFAVGVQWHPELMWQEDKAHIKLFENFVESCRQ